MIKILFLAKNSQASMCVSWCFIMVHNPWLAFPQFFAFLTNCFMQSAHNFKVVFIIDRTTLWQEFVMHHAIATMSKTFTFYLSWRAFIGLGSSGRFHIVAIQPWFATSYELFEQIWIVVKRSQHLLSDVHATFSNFGTIFAAVRFMPVNTVIESWLKFCFWPKTHAQASMCWAGELS